MNNAEVLIIGSGPAGINVAWPLVTSGISVVMVDGSNNNIPNPPSNTTIGNLRKSADGWRYFLGDGLEGLYADKDISLKFSTPIGNAVINDTKGFLGLSLDHMTAARTGATGGLSNIWGAHCSTYDEEDLLRYPIGYEDIKSSYYEVSRRIGICGINDDLGGFHGLDCSLQPPGPLTKPAKYIYDNYKKSTRTEDFVLGLARNAVITSNLNGRDGCNQCGLCLYGCSRKSIYNGAYELDQLKTYANFKHFSGVIIDRIIDLNSDNKKVQIKGGESISARNLIIAAGTINSTAMILEYLGAYDYQLPLLSNPVAALAYVIPQYIGSNFDPLSFSLGQLSYRLDLQSGSEYATGVIYGADCLPLNSFARHMGFSSPTSLRLANILSPSLLLATTYLPGSFSSNSISISRAKEGKKFQGPEIIVAGGLSNEAILGLKFASKKLSKNLMKFGAYQIPGSYKIAIPGADAHLVGTIPMGNKGDFGCSDICELNFAKDVFIVDGSCLTALPAKHCTFTIMANAFRVGKALANKLISKQTG